MIPRSMEKLERLVMPTGFTFNMDGTAIYMSIGILFLAHTLKVHLTVTEQFTHLSRDAVYIKGRGRRHRGRVRRAGSHVAGSLRQRSGLPPT